MDNQLIAIINDFFNCKSHPNEANYFYGDPLAQHFSLKILSANQRKRFKHHEIVPMEFINYLKNSELGKLDIEWPRGPISVRVLSKLLNGTYKPTMLRRYPMLKESFF